MVSSSGTAWQFFILGSILKDDGRWGHVLAASASPSSSTQKLAMSPSATVHGGQYDTKYVALELLLDAAFAADISLNQPS